MEELHNTLFWPNPSLTKSLLKQVPPLFTNLGFFFPVFSPGWKVFSPTISMIFWFSSHISSLSLEVFHQLIPLSDFPPQSSLTVLKDFSPATWYSFETHQFPYEARLFSLVPRFSSLVSLIELRSLSPDSHSGSYSNFHWGSHSSFLQSLLSTNSTLSGARVWRGRQL